MVEYQTVFKTTLESFQKCFDAGEHDNVFTELIKREVWVYSSMDRSDYHIIETLGRRELIPEFLQYPKNYPKETSFLS